MAASQFERVMPDIDPGDPSTRPWLVALSDWPPGRAEDLLGLVRGAFENAGPVGALPTVLVVNDLVLSDPGLRAFLTHLTIAGAAVLEPDDDPVGFTTGQLGAAWPAPAPAPGDGRPSQPAGYEQFGTAVTRLSPQELDDLTAGRLPPDWRYDS